MEQNYICDILSKILLLQRQEFDPDLSSCDRPFLGPTGNITLYNTRPVQLYNAYTGTPWTLPYTSGTTTSTSDVFRVEAIEKGTVMVRLLSLDAETGSYTNTNQFATIVMDTIGAIVCLPDTFVTL